jgi:hypothetical protein
MDGFIGSPLPDVTTTQTQTTTAPDWYSNYLSGIAQAGEQAVQTGGVAGFSPLQQQAFSAAPSAIQAGQPALQTATETATGVATNPFMQNVSQYMNPYTQSVIEEMNRLGQRQFRETLAPGVTAGAVGSGQFGSKRGMETYGNVARDVNRDILGAQAKYLAQGFDQATAMAKAQADLNLAASGRLGELSKLGYEQGVGGLNVLSGLGAQQQANEQAMLDYPMSAATKQSALLRGFNVPTSVENIRTGPMTKDYYAPAPLSEILRYLTTASGLALPVGSGDQSRINYLISGLSELLPKSLTDFVKSIYSTTPTSGGDAEAQEGGFYGETSGGGTYGGDAEAQDGGFYGEYPIVFPEQSDYINPMDESNDWIYQ